MYRVGRRFRFHATHQLHGMPPGHPCSGVHGHDYVVEMEMSATVLNDVGEVLDCGYLDEFAAHVIDGVVSDRHLNDLPHIGNPTNENLARWVCDRSGDWGYTRVTAVRVWDSPDTWGEHRR